jgi:Ca2+-binding RTX toxin-like protein
MAGGKGNDIYIVDDASDAVIENVNEGIDTVKSSTMNLLLGGNVEKATLTGKLNLSAIGNALDNSLVGNTGANVLNGKAGADTLKGGAGADTFVFDILETSANADKIVDFVSGADHINLSVSAFNALAGYGLGTLDLNELTFGTAATTASQHLIYDTAKGFLYYDADGVGGTTQLEIAALSNHPTLVSSDIVLI